MEPSPKKARTMALVTISKIDTYANLVFGWASVAIRKGGEIIQDYDGDVINPETLEHAIYKFNLDFRGANEEHVGPVIGALVESLAVTASKLTAMGLAEDALPLGWWCGFHIPDTAVFNKIITKEYQMFSIEGTARREEVQ